MKGLLIKDLKLMLTQKIFLLVILIMGAAVTVPSGEISTGFGYITAITGIFAVTTINYDSYDNGFPFIFSFPISRKEYVKEKYIFAIMSSVVLMAFVGAFVWLLMTAVYPERNYPVMDFLWEMSDCYMITLMVTAILLPVYLEFGAEKSKYVILIIGGIFMAMLTAFTLEDALELTQPAGIKRMVFLIICLAILAVSYIISCKIMEKKEF